MNRLELCMPRSGGTTCWTLTAKVQDTGARSWVLTLLKELQPTLVGALLSLGVAILLLHLARRRERRKTSLDTYKEFYSEEVSERRYAAEEFLDGLAGTDWAATDPYEVANPDDKRKGYAAVTRYWARLAFLYLEKELDRRLTEKLMSRMAGYWWGFVYERMTMRTDMFTGPQLRAMFDSMKNGSHGLDFEAGYLTGTGRHRPTASEPAGPAPS